MSDVILGCRIIFVSIGLCSGLVFWARRHIDRTARGVYRTAREILQERTRGR